MTTQTDIDIEKLLGPANPWQLIIWNDDVNDIDHVVGTLARVLEIPAGRAEHLAMEAHTTGKAIACDGEKEKMLHLAEAITAALITATVEQPS